MIILVWSKHVAAQKTEIHRAALSTLVISTDSLCQYSVGVDKQNETADMVAHILFKKILTCVFKYKKLDGETMHLQFVFLYCVGIVW